MFGGTECPVEHTTERLTSGENNLFVTELREGEQSEVEAESRAEGCSPDLHTQRFDRFRRAVFWGREGRKH